MPAMVDGERYKKLMIEAFIPAVKACMPRPEGHTIFVQQDGERHTPRWGSWRQSRRRWGVMLSEKPSEPTDLNVNDLGFFHSIQQLKEYVGMTNTQELVEATAEAFNVYPRGTLERVW
ncbi:unnamed protein product [Discosporangium mesarthrocarpum]